MKSENKNPKNETLPTEIILVKKLLKNSPQKTVKKSINLQ